MSHRAKFRRPHLSVAAKDIVYVDPANYGIIITLLAITIYIEQNVFARQQTASLKEILIIVCDRNVHSNVSVLADIAKRSLRLVIYCVIC